MKRVTVSLMAFTIIAIMFAAQCFAFTLLTKEQALEKFFADVDEYKAVNHVLSAEEVTAIKEKMGGSLVHYQAGSNSADVAEATKYDFYIGMKDNKPVRMAIIEEQPGKWGPVEFIVAIDTATAKVINVAVMSYQEKRGRPIARQNFLKQFFGKGSADPISVRGEKGVRRDIRSISGATISSDCACFAVRKVVALYENVYVNMKQDITQLIEK